MTSDTFAKVDVGRALQKFYDDCRYDAVRQTIDVALDALIYVLPYEFDPTHLINRVNEHVRRSS